MRPLLSESGHGDELLTNIARPGSSLTDVISHFNVQILFMHNHYSVFNESGDVILRIFDPFGQSGTYPYDSSDFLTADIVTSSNDWLCEFSEASVHPDMWFF
jgi:hypothetical protein